MNNKIIGIAIGVLILGVVIFSGMNNPEMSKSHDSKTYKDVNSYDLKITEDVCRNFDLITREGATNCFRDLVKKGYFEKFEQPTADDALFKLVSLGAIQSSAEWAVYNNLNLLFIPLSTSNYELENMIQNFTTDCWDEGGCETCHTAFEDGGVLIETSCVNVELCETQVEIIYMRGDYIHSEFYDYQSSGC